MLRLSMHRYAFTLGHFIPENVNIFQVIAVPVLVDMDFSLARKKFFLREGVRILWRGSMNCRLGV